MYKNMTKERVSNSSDLENTPPKFESPLWTLTEICEATGGSCDSKDKSGIERVFTDSRKIKSGDLFIPLQGPLFDGHDFIQDAFDSGAVGALVQKEFDGSKITNGVLIYVDDVMDALDDLARESRKRTTAKIIAVTGSYGKTSMKDILSLALSSIAPTHKTERSFNNHWGLPLTLSNLHRDHHYAVIEMGMNAAGEIRTHSLMVQPHVALITNTGDAHIGKLGSLENVAKAKAEIFEGLIDKNATVILYSENWATKEHMTLLKSKGISVLTFGEMAVFSVANKLSPKGLEFFVTEEKTDFAARVFLPVFAKHWGVNIAACAATLKALALEWQTILPSLSSLYIPAGRGVVEQVTLYKNKQNQQTNAGKFILIDDSYNAAPGSMKKSLEALAFMKRTSNRTIAVLGDMLELGQESEAYHVGLKNIQGFSDIDLIYTSGPEMQKLYDLLPLEQKGLSCELPQDIADNLVKDVRPSDIILVKGSRGQWADQGRMVVVVETLKQLGQKDQIKHA